MAPLRNRIVGLREVPASMIDGAPWNWRTHPDEQRAVVQASIEELGIIDALKVREMPDGRYQLFDGHLRNDLYVTISPDTLVPVLVTDLDESEAKKANAIFDPSAAMAEADAAKLKALLSTIETDSDAIERMLLRLAEEFGSAMPLSEPGGGGDQFDPTPELEGPTRTTVGDLWLIDSKHRLFVGDCTRPENISRLFDGRTPAVMVTDPPYGVAYDPTWRHRAGVNKSKRVGKVANDDRADWTEAWRLFPGNICYVWHGALHGATVFESLAAAGLMVRSQIIWVKPRLVLSRGHYHWKHEPAFVGERQSPTAETDEAAELGYYAIRKGGSAEWEGGRKQTTVWQIGFAGEEKTHHGTQKPIECMARPMRNHGTVGDSVYDPFLGSGTSLIAAHRSARYFLGCELDPRYADVCLRRAEAEGLTVEKIG